MFRLRAPSPEVMARFLAAMNDAKFSFAEVGASRNDSLAGYTRDQHRIQLGEGSATFARAVEAVRAWQMFKLGWVRVFQSDAPIQVGSTVMVLAQHFGIWSLNACRIVYVVDEPRCFGFAYGTLREHVERGEERFTVEWRDDDSVWYDMLAYSRPNHWLAKLGYPVSRLFQKRFARDSKRAMLNAVGNTNPHSTSARSS